MHLELAAKASVHGNVYYNLIEMAMGAAVNGSLVHQREPAGLLEQHTDKEPVAISHDERAVTAKIAEVAE